MDMMLLGEMLVANAAGQTHTGFWMPAGGNDGVAAVEVFLQTVASGFIVHMDTKSSDEDDASATLSIGSVTLSSISPLVHKFDVSNARDLVRYRAVSSKLATVHLQFAQPLWQPN